MKLRQWILSNHGLKVVALVAATFIWLFVKAVTSGTRTVEGVALEFKTQTGWTVTYAQSHTVKVTIRGTTEDLWQAARYELTAVVDLQHEDHVGRTQAPILLRDVRHPRRIQVVAIEPTNVVVRLDKIVE